MPTRRELLAATSAVGIGALVETATLARQSAPDDRRKEPYRIGVISARNQGQPQRTNGHTWQFTESFHADCNMDAIRKLLDPGRVELFEKHLRNPREHFNILPHRDVRVTHYYEKDPEIAKLYTEAFPGVEVASSVEQMAKEVDAVWLGDGSGVGDDHFDLIAPALERGLPAFCDKPIGGTVAGTKKILELARKNKAPIMSSSLFRHQWGTEEAVRLRDAGEFGELEYVIASMGGRYSADRWAVYGQHPAWTVMTICGPGVEAVSAYAVPDRTCHALVTYADRLPAEIWFGRPDVSNRYNETSVHFTKDTYTYSPAIEGNRWYGHHYQMINMANVFLDMVRTGIEPVPHQEILEVTAIVHAGVKSMKEKSRLVSLEEVMG
jgi:predicted dehydrogenase